MMQRPKPMSWPIALAAAVLVLVSSSSAFGTTQVLAGHKQKLQNNTHALGLTFGVAGATGFAYRYYLGNYYVQASVLPLVADQGDYLAMLTAVQFAHYLLVWNNTTAGKMLPTTTALRVSLGGSAFWLTEKKDAISHQENTLAAQFGFGFEMGAVMRPGFSISFDVLLTSIWENGEFDSLIPMPYGAVMYSW